MSYRCDGCKGKVPHGQTEITRVTEVREKKYSYGAVGWETAKKSKFCKKCADKYDEAHANA